MAAPNAQEYQPLYMCEMMKRLNIEPGDGVVPRLSLIYATAFHRCQACPSIPACRVWLDSMPASAPFAPRFCPNADILFELQVEQPGPATAIDVNHHAHEADGLAKCRHSRDG